MSKEFISTEQKDLMRKAFKLTREAFPDVGIQVSFNLSPKGSDHYDSMSYNIKASGVDK